MNDTQFSKTLINLKKGVFWTNSRKISLKNSVVFHYKMPKKHYINCIKLNTQHSVVQSAFIKSCYSKLNK